MICVTGVEHEQTVWRPRWVIFTAVGFSVVFVVGALLGWFGLPPDIRDLFEPFQIITLLAILAAIFVLLWFLASSSVRLEADGFTVRNAWQRRRLAWSAVDRVVLRPGDPWAVAVLNEHNAEGEPRTILLFGLQGSEGRSTRQAVALLNERIRDTAQG